MSRRFRLMHGLVLLTMLLSMISPASRAAAQAQTITPVRVTSLANNTAVPQRSIPPVAWKPESAVNRTTPPAARPSDPASEVRILTDPTILAQAKAVEQKSTQPLSWSGYYGDVNKASAVVGDTVSQPPYALAWATAGLIPSANPLVNNGKLFVSYMNDDPNAIAVSELKSFNLADGALQWSVAAPANSHIYSMVSDSSRVYAFVHQYKVDNWGFPRKNDSYWIYAYQQSTGSLVWSRKLVDLDDYYPRSRSPLVLSDTSLYITTLKNIIVTEPDYTLFQLDLATGAILNQHDNSFLLPVTAKSGKILAYKRKMTDQQTLDPEFDVVLLNSSGSYLSTIYTRDPEHSGEEIASTDSDDYYASEQNGDDGTAMGLTIRRYDSVTGALEATKVLSTIRMQSNMVYHQGSLYFFGCACSDFLDGIANTPQLYKLNGQTLSHTIVGSGFSLGEDAVKFSLSASNQTLYITHDASKDSPSVLAMSLSTGSIVWKGRYGIYTRNTPAVAINQRLVVFTGKYLTVYAPGVDRPSGHDLLDCNCTKAGEHQGNASNGTGSSVNTNNGNYSYPVPGVGIPSPDGEIGAGVVYNSANAPADNQAQLRAKSTGTAFGPVGLSPGWTHTYNAWLDFNSMSQTVIYNGMFGAKIHFSYTGSLGAGVSFSHNPEVFAELTYETPTDPVLPSPAYVLTTSTQDKLYFNTKGQLKIIQNTQGGRQRVLYTDLTTTSWRVNRVESVRDTTKAITFNYTNNVLTTMRDSTTRAITLSYNGAGDIDSIRNVMNQPESFSYNNHLITERRDSLNRVIEQNYFSGGTDVGGGVGILTPRLEKQGTNFVGTTANIKTSFDYGLDDRTITYKDSTDKTISIRTDRYALNNTLVSQRLNGIEQRQQVLGTNLVPTEHQDALGRITTQASNSMGKITKVTNTLNQTTAMTYNAQMRPSELRNPNNHLMTSQYDTAGNLIRQTTAITNLLPLGRTTIYTYNVRYPGKNWLEESLSTDKLVTWYEYNANGQIVSQTSAKNTSNPQTTTYQYDTLGRRIATTTGVNTPNTLTTKTEYRPDGQVAKTIVNPVVGTGNATQNVTTEYGYDQLGRQIWTKLPNGSYQDYTAYNQAGQVIWTVTNPINSAGKPALPTDTTNPPSFNLAYPTGNITTKYTYDSLGRVSLTGQTGIVTGTFNIVTQQWSQSTERYSLVQYDSLSRPVTTTLNYWPGINGGKYNPRFPDVNLKNYTYYDAVGNPVWQGDQANRWTKTEYDALNRPVTVTLNYENGDPASIDVNNRSWAALIDTDIIEITRYNQFGVAQRISNYDPRTNGTWSATAPITNRVTLNHYNSLGMMVGSTNNSAPGVTGRTDVNRTTNSLINLTTSRLLASQDVMGQWTVPQYDDLGRVIYTVTNCRQGATPASSNCGPSTGSVSGTIDRNFTSATTSYDALGRAYQSTNVNGIVSRTNYDILSRPIQTIQNYKANPTGSDPTPLNVTNSTNYIDVGGQRWTTTDATGRVTSYEANALGQTIAVTDTANLRTSYGYDGSGAQRWVKLPDGSFNVNVVDGMGSVVKQITNYKNGVYEAANDDNDKDLIATSVFTSSGELIASLDSIGRKTSYRYDLRGNLVQVIQNDSPTCQASASDCRLNTVYRYDRVGNRTAIIDANGNTRSMTYDAANRLVSETDAANFTLNYEYNLRDAGTKKIGYGTGNSRPTIGMTYDELGRQTRTMTTNTVNGLGFVDYQYTYDALGRRTSFNDLGAQDLRNGRTGQMDYQFDALNRIIGEQRSVVGDPVASQWTLGYGYDAAGRVTNVGSTNYQYDSAGRPSQVLRSTSLIAQYGYTAQGKLSTIQNWDNGSLRATTTRSYDDANRITSLTTTGINNTGANSQLSSYSYTYNRAGEPTTFSSMQRLANATTTTDQHGYTYDRVGRLIEEVDQANSLIPDPTTTTSTYSYDKAGNRIGVFAQTSNMSGSQVVTNKTINPAANGRVTNVTNNLNGTTSTNWTYDAWGNLTNDAQRTYTYDSLSRLRTTVQNGNTYSYDYHGENVILRTATTSGGTTSQTALLHNTVTGPYSSLLRIYGLPGSAAYTTYAYGPEGGLLWSEYTGTTPTRRMAYFSDAQGTLRQQVNLATGVTGTQDSDAWGVLTGASAPMSSLRYTGEYTDFDTGMVFLRARWYNPTHGLFQSEDPFAGFAEQPYSMHRYQYGYSNPTTNSDPSGRCLGWLVNWLIDYDDCEFVGWDNVKSGDLNYEDGARVVIFGATTGIVVVACASTAGAGCAVAGFGSGALSSWANQSIDNSGQPVFDAITNIDWVRVGLDGGMSMLSGKLGGATGVIGKNLCTTGKACNILIETVMEAVDSGGTQLIENVIDGDSSTGVFDNVAKACLMGAIFGGGQGGLKTFKAHSPDTGNSGGAPNNSSPAHHVKVPIGSYNVKIAPTIEPYWQDEFDGAIFASTIYGDLTLRPALGGVSTSDIVTDAGISIDVYRPVSKNLDNIGREVADKQQNQAKVVIIDTRATHFTEEDILNSLSTRGSRQGRTPINMSDVHLIPKNYVNQPAPSGVPIKQR